MKFFLSILFIFLVLTSCGNIEEAKLIAESKKKEDYRIWTTEKSLTNKDSIYSERKSFNVYDTKDRLINENNIIFYYYDETKNRIEKTKSISKRDRNIKIKIQDYEYDENGLLKYIIEKNEQIDTLKSYKYDSNKNLIEIKTNYRTVNQEFENNLLKKRVVIEGDSESRISEFKYDSLNRPILDKWIFSGNHQMKTRFEYNDNGLLFREIDSTFVQGTNPNHYIEFMNEYKYDKNDSIVEIIKSGRVLNESDFKVRGRTIFERKTE